VRYSGLESCISGADQFFQVIARSAAVLLHIDVIFILLPVCRNFVSVLRRTPIGTVIPFDENLTLHKATGWSIFIWSLVHTLAHVVNLYRLTMADNSAKTTGQRVTFFITANFIIGSSLPHPILYQDMEPSQDRYGLDGSCGSRWESWSTLRSKSGVAPPTAVLSASGIRTTCSSPSSSSGNSTECSA
jgi:hypothetical protein